MTSTTKLPFEALGRLGYDEDDLRRLGGLAHLGAIAGAPLDGPEGIRAIVSSLPYFDDWRTRYVVQSVRSSLASQVVTCIDAAILSYGILDCFPSVRRRVLAIHRRSAAGEECGHVVTLYWQGGKVGAFSKSSYPGLGHRDPVFRDEEAIARSYAEAYLRLGLRPLYYGVTTLEEAAGDLDWRFSPADLSELSSRIQACYEYAFLPAAAPSAQGHSPEPVVDPAPASQPTTEI